MAVGRRRVASGHLGFAAGLDRGAPPSASNRVWPCSWFTRRPYAPRASARIARLTHRGGFELAAGLPFVASDPTIHHLLAEHPVADSIALQVMLGKLRRAGGDFCGKVLAVDPHRMRSYSNRRMRSHAHHAAERPDQDGANVLAAGRRHEATRLFHHRYLVPHGNPRHALVAGHRRRDPRPAPTRNPVVGRHGTPQRRIAPPRGLASGIRHPGAHGPTPNVSSDSSSPSREKPSCIAGRASRPPAGPISPNAAMPGLSRSLSNAAESDPTTGATRHSCRLPKAMKSRR